VWLEGVCTHFSSADEPLYVIDGETQRQATAFEEIVNSARAEGIDTGLVHAANSAAIFRSSTYHYDMVRPGVALYGYHPFSAGELPGTEVQPVLSLFTRIVRLARLEVGEAVSYGRTFVCERPEEIATLPVGYADGMPRLLSGTMLVKVRGGAAQIAGRICMDQMMAVVTGLDAELGDVVQVYGESAMDGVASMEVAAARMGTISYELLCAISARVPRVYVGG